MKDYVLLFSSTSNITTELAKENGDFLLGEIINENEGMDYSHHGTPMYEQLTSIKELETGDVFVHNSMADYNKYNFVKLNDIEHTVDKVINNHMRTIARAKTAIEKTKANKGIIYSITTQHEFKNLNRTEKINKEIDNLNKIDNQLSKEQAKIQSDMDLWINQKLSAKDIENQQQRIDDCLLAKKSQENKLIKISLAESGFDNFNISNDTITFGESLNSNSIKKIDKKLFIHAIKKSSDTKRISKLADRINDAKQQKNTFQSKGNKEKDRDIKR